MSNYCACSGGDEEYTIELNQQGPEGPQGEVGPEGFSPSISVKTNTDKAYILTVVNKEGNFDTPNLYGEIEKLNADLSNIPNPAYINGVSLSSIEDNIPMITMDSSRITTNVDGNLILNATASNEETMEVSNYEVVVNPKEQRLELHDNEGNIKIVATTDYIPTINIATVDTVGVVKPDGNTITVTPDGTISAVQQDLSNLATKEELNTLDTTLSADIATLDADKLEQSNIIAGANITIDRNGNNLTINSIGGGGGGGASIDDSTISSASTWSSSKINSEITTVANTKNDNIFDIGKFTVVGSPTITNDGVASGFSSTNYLTFDTSIFANDITDFDFYLPFKINSIPAARRHILRGQLDGKFRFLLVSDADGTIKFNFSSFEQETVVIPQSSLNLNINYIVKLSLHGGNLEYGYYQNGIYTKSGSITVNYIAQMNWFTIGGNRSTSSFENGSIDLSHFSITVDGKEVFNGLMESTKPIYDKLSSTSTELSTFKTDTDNNFSAVNSALNEKANLSDLAGYVTVNKYNELLARVVALETEINGGNA